MRDLNRNYRPVNSQRQLEEAAIYQVEGMTIHSAESRIPFGVDDPDTYLEEVETRVTGGFAAHIDKDPTDITTRAVNVIAEFDELFDKVQKDYASKENLFKQYIRCTQDLHNAEDGIKLLGKAIHDHYEEIQAMDFLESQHIWGNYNKAKAYLQKVASCAKDWRGDLWEDAKTARDEFYATNDKYKVAHARVYDETTFEERMAAKSLAKSDIWDTLIGTGFGSESFDLEWFRGSAPGIYDRYNVDMNATDAEVDRRQVEIHDELLCYFDNRNEEWGGMYRLHVSTEERKAYWREFFKAKRANAFKTKRRMKAMSIKGKYAKHRKFGTGEVIDVQYKGPGRVYAKVNFREGVIKVDTRYLKPAQAPVTKTDLPF